MYVLYSIYVLQNNDGISMDEEKTMGRGLGGVPPPVKRYLMLDRSSKRGIAEDLVLSRELCKSVACGAFPSIFDPTPKNNPNYSVLKLEYPNVAKKRLSKLVLRPEKDNTLAQCTYLW
jgi:hypothetical protein